MGTFVNPDNSAFQSALKAKIYVDKTELLQHINAVLGSSDAFICNSRPRRFGKSVTANMLTAYYSRGCDSKTMFAGLKISSSPDFEEHLNQYDVIHIDMQWSMEPAGGADRLISYITSKTIEELREYYPEILPMEIRSLPEALSRIHTAKKIKFVVIIDEWDVLIRDEANNRKIQEEYICFLRGMFKGTEPTKYIQLAYLTGILPIKKIKTQSALNNFEEYTMLGAGFFSPYVGFSEEEVKRLCLQYGQNFEQVEKWYNGYILKGEHVYNPKAVISVLLRGEFQSYWSKTGSYKEIIPLINSNFDGFREAVIKMLSGAFVEVNVNLFQNDPLHFADKNDVFTYLIHLGYLGYDSQKKAAFIPNEEIRQEFQDVLKLRKWNELAVLEAYSCELLDMTLREDEDAVAKEIDRIHSEYTSVLQYNNENSLSCVVTLAYLSCMQYYFKPKREMPTGYGFADLVYLPKPEYRLEYPALILELKWNKNVQTALSQIKEKKYPESVQEYTGNILLVGISYDKKTKLHQCRIEKYEK